VNLVEVSWEELVVLERAKSAIFRRISPGEIARAARKRAALPCRFGGDRRESFAKIRFWARFIRSGPCPPSTWSSTPVDVGSIGRSEEGGRAGRHFFRTAERSASRELRKKEFFFCANSSTCSLEKAGAAEEDWRLDGPGTRRATELMRMPRSHQFVVRRAREGAQTQLLVTRSRLKRLAVPLDTGDAGVPRRWKAPIVQVCKGLLNREVTRPLTLILKISS